MANKDFLSSLTEETKPESFKEEKRIKVEKPKVKIPAWLIGTVVGVILLVAALLVWFLIIPHIPMDNFVGKTTKEVQGYLTQYKVDPQGIRFEEEYNYDYEAGTIISQSISADKKIKKNAVITFIVSKGADPEESIKVPDLETMTKSEIQKWIDNNKLSNTKISVAYSDEVEKDEVISVIFKNDDRDEFKRSSQLTINVSKGAAPAAEVKITDFKDKTYAEVEEFAKEKKLKITKQEILSTEVEKGLVCYTKPGANEKIKEGETLTVYISKGKATVLPDLVDKTTDDYSIWKMGKGKDVVTYEKYVETTDKSLDKTIKEQSPAAGTKVTDEVFVVTIYKYVEEEPEVSKITIPNLVNKTKDDYEIWLLGDGSKATTYTLEVSTTDEDKNGIIKEQSIKAGTKITTEVFVVTIYKYEKQITAPDLIDKTIDDYNIWKLGDGKNITTYEKYELTTDEDKNGKIKEQLPVAGETIGDQVFTITIYKYKNPNPDTTE